MDKALEIQILQRQKRFKIISLTSYLLIMLAGDFIAFPLLVWLLFTSFDYGNTDQLFAGMGILGVVLSVISLRKTRTVIILLLDIVCLLLLASPLIRRLSAVSIGKFYYAGFIIPTTIFVISYFISLYYAGRQVSRRGQKRKRMQKYD